MTNSKQNKEELSKTIPYVEPLYNGIISNPRKSDEYYEEAEKELANFKL